MLLFLSIFGIFLSSLLFIFNWRKYKSSRYLCAFFIVISLYGFFYHGLFYSKSVLFISFLLLLINFAFIFYLAGPLIYWYIRSMLTDDSRLKKKDLWHLIPSVIYLVFSIPLVFTSWHNKKKIAGEILQDANFLQGFNFTVLSEMFSVQALYLSRPVLLLGYILWSTVLVFRYLHKNRYFYVFVRQRFMMIWLLVFLGLVFVLTTSHLLNILKPFPEFIALNIFHIISGAGLLCLLISPFFFPSILYGLPQFISPAIQKEVDHSISVKKKQTCQLENDYLFTVGSKIEVCMTVLRPYLQSDFNLVQLAVLIHIPVHHLFYYFKEIKKQHFHDYCNRLRIEYSKNLMKQGKAKGITIEGIGLLSGFSNRNTFFTAFKKAEGISPGNFIDQNPV